MFQVLRIQGDSHIFIQRVKDKVSKFILKIVDHTILLREITANFVNKKPYLEKMIALIDPRFDFKAHELKITRILKFFELKREKHKNFLLWAQRFALPVNVKTFQEEISSIENNYDVITARDTIYNRQEETSRESSKT